MVHGTKKDLIKIFTDMGYSEEVAIQALEKNNNNQERALEYILQKDENPNRSVVPYGPDPSPASRLKNDEEELAKAIELSLQEPSANPMMDQKERDPNIPIGLKASGNIPFFTSLLQFYHSVPSFKQVILNQNTTMQINDPQKKKLVKLISELASLFEKMDKSRLKYEDTFGVVNAWIDIEGSHALSNEKSNIADFSFRFVVVVEEGLRFVNNVEVENVVRRKDSVNFLEEGCFIAGFCCGKAVRILSGKDSAGVKVKKELPAFMFSKFELDVDDKELYEAWGNSLVTKIENFQHEESLIVKGKKQSWIEQLPGVLIFEINRLAHDSNGNLIKRKKPFQFPHVLHPGRFLMRNRSKSLKLQRSMTQNKKKVKELEMSIEKLEKYNGSELNIAKMLKLCSEFLKSQQQEFNIDESGIQLYSPSAINLNEPGYEIACETVKLYADKVESELEYMKQQHSASVKEIESTFDNPKLIKNEYKLSTIIVHDGEAGSGQYFSYMMKDGSWKKFQDTNVSEVGEKQVMFDSLGEYGISAACCLIYIQRLEANS